MDLYEENLKAVKEVEQGSELYYLLEKVAYKQWLKDQNKSSNENWVIAQEKTAKWAAKEKDIGVWLKCPNELNEYLSEISYRNFPEEDCQESRQKSLECIADFISNS